PQRRAARVAEPRYPFAHQRQLEDVRPGLGRRVDLGSEVVGLPGKDIVGGGTPALRDARDLLALSKPPPPELDLSAMVGRARQPDGLPRIVRPNQRAEYAVVARQRGARTDVVSGCQRGAGTKARADGCRAHIDAAV